MTEAKVRFSLKEGILEIEGPQAFVEKQLESFGPLIKGALSGQQPQKGPAPTPEDKKLAGDSGQAIENEWPNVFEKKGEKVHLLVEKIPGDTDKDKTVNLAMLEVLASEMTGKEEVPFSAIRQQCERHGCFNKANFSKYLKDETKLFLIGGTPKKQTAQLTAPGRVKAKELATDLNAKSE